MSYQHYQPKALTCCDCNQQFVFSAEDQEHFAQKGYTNEPKRCPTCRATRRSERGPSDSGYRGGYGQSERQMYPVTCAQCGKATEVPFQPRGERPVYCSDCFRQQPRSDSNYSSYGRNSRSR